MLVAGALALPAGALASVTVHPAKTTEGNSGKQTATTNVDLNCDQHLLAVGYGYCDYTLHFTAGSATGLEDYAWDPPEQLRLLIGQKRSVAMHVEVLGDTKVERDETYNLNVEESIHDYGQERENSTADYLAGTIVNDDTAICAVCGTGTLPAGPSSGNSTPAPADPAADPTPTQPDPGNGDGNDGDDGGGDPGDD